MMDQTSDDIGSDSDDINLTIARANDFQKTVDDYQNVEVERATNLNNITKIVGRLLKKSNVSMGTQTDYVEFADSGDNNSSMPLSIGIEPKPDEEISNPIQRSPTMKSPSSKFNRAFTIRPSAENSLSLYGKPNQMLGGMDESRLKELHMNLNQIINKHKKKKESQIKKDLDQGKYIWTTPAMILCFLSNTVEQATQLMAKRSETDISPGTEISEAKSALD